VAAERVAADVAKAAAEVDQIRPVAVGAAGKTPALAAMRIVGKQAVACFLSGDS